MPFVAKGPHSIARPSSTTYVYKTEPINPLHSKTPILPRALLQRQVEAPRDWTGAPATPLIRRDIEREVVVQRTKGFFPTIEGSPLQLGVRMTEDDLSLLNLNPRDALVGWSSPAPATPGSASRPSFAATISPTRHGKKAMKPGSNVSSKSSAFYNNNHAGVKPNPPMIRTVPAALPLHHTSPLCHAKNLKHKLKLEQEHDVAPRDEMKGVERVDDEDNESMEKQKLEKLKKFIGDKATTASWKLEVPLKSWKRVRTDKVGIHVEGLSLVSTKMQGDVKDLCELLEGFHHLKLLLVHNNPGLVGDIRHFSSLKHLKELRIPGEGLVGNINGLSSFVDLQKLRIYNRKEIDGLEVDLKKMLPHCDIDIDAA